MSKQYNKRGVGTIIAGVFLVGIVGTTLLFYFLGITQAQYEKSKKEIDIQNFKNEQLLEDFSISISPHLNNSRIGFSIVNKGSSSLVIKYIMITNLIENKQFQLITDPPLVNRFNVLNSGETSNILFTKPIDTSLLSRCPIGSNYKCYKIDVITEKGNIKSVTYPPDLIANNNQTNSNQGIVIRSFGAIFPEFRSADVDQRGWLVSINNGLGYPALTLIENKITYLTIALQNKDPKGQAIKLFADSAIIITQESVIGSTQKPLYICKTNFNNGSVEQYNNNQPIILPNVKDSIEPTNGLVKLVFCDTNVRTNQFNAEFRPTSSDLNLIFLSLKGEYEDGTPYSQIIPYNTLFIPSNSFTVLASNYSGTPNSIITLKIVRIYTPPYDIYWIDKDNKHKLLTTSSNNLINITIPPNSEREIYVIQIKDSEGRVYYITFRVR